MRWPAIACTFFILLMLPGATLAGVSNASNGHFSITYTTGSAPGIDHASFNAVLEKAYDRVNGTFGTCPGHIEVIVVDDRAMDEEAGAEVDAFSAWNRMMSAMALREDALKNRSLPVVVEHEMTHLAINEILCKKDPREFQWMEEGICTLFSGEPLRGPDVSRYIVGHGFLEVEDIRDAIKNPNCTVSKNGYMQSYSLVERMARRFGRGAVIHMLACPEKSLDQAFRQSTGEDFRVFYREWEKAVVTEASR